MIKEQETIYNFNLELLICFTLLQDSQLEQFTHLRFNQDHLTVSVVIQAKYQY